MMTYLVVWFSSEGGKPSEITQRLLSMGFSPVEGQYDYVYKWSEEASVDQILKIGDQVRNTLKGLDVMYKLETVYGRD